MNSSHAASLHALALDYVRSRKGEKTKVSFVKMGGSVTLDSFTLSFVECQSGDMCVMNTAKIHFYPPLGSGELLLSLVHASFVILVNVHISFFVYFLRIVFMSHNTTCISIRC